MDSRLTSLSAVKSRGDDGVSRDSLLFVEGQRRSLEVAT
jgi:hypothetical protein